MTKKNPNLYEPGLYWKDHHKNLAIYLKKNPLSNFRNSKLKAIQAFSGSSIAQTSGGVAPLQGTAYKIYACGKFFDQGGNLSIIVPLESVVVMPY